MKRTFGKLQFSNLLVLLAFSIRDLGFSFTEIFVKHDHFLELWTSWVFYFWDISFIIAFMLLWTIVENIGIGPDLVLAHHCFQPKIRSVTYSVHGVSCTDTTLLHIACSYWLSLLLCSMVAGSEDVPAFLLYLPLVQGSLRFIKALFMYYSNRLCIYFIFALYTLFLEAHDLYYQFLGIV